MRQLPKKTKHAIPTCGASEGLSPNLWEVTAWEMEHLGSCPWEIAFWKEPKTDFTPHLNSDTWIRNLLNHIFILIILYRVTHKG